MYKNIEAPLCFLLQLWIYSDRVSEHRSRPPVWKKDTHSLSGIGLDSCMVTQIKALTWWHDITFNIPLIPHQLHICATPVSKLMKCISVLAPVLSIGYFALMTSLILLCFFSRGATSVVYRCEEKQTEKPYAAKILKKTVSQFAVLEGLLLVISTRTIFYTI